ncbi:hypothetical protein DL96DRAFT_1812780 [Flagelloscypha sp. PMI_526]|nr:hypothetical protein DL96DRAFT_1812780 [Flagelloscypha sp. PMI_526]
MDSLTTLVTSLPGPSQSQQQAEKELSEKFKGAALALTTLYKSSRDQSKRAYDAGYEAACRDVLAILQAEAANADVSRHVSKWLEARIDAVKGEDASEEDEDEPSKPAPPPQTSSPSANRTGRTNSPTVTSRATPWTPLLPVPPAHLPSTDTFTFPPLPEHAPIVGTKRRHAVMLFDGAPTAGASTTTPSVRRDRGRRRTRSARDLENSGMDIDEDGRERKRVARR